MLALPTGFNIGSLTITFYAIFILTGVLIGVFMAIKEGKRLGISSDSIYLGVLITLPIAIIAARLWYVLFNITSFHSFAEVLGFKNGKFEGLSGLAIQGGIIATVITVYLYCRKRKISFYKIMDVVLPGMLFGQALGRWGNFFNQELYGPAIVTDWYKAVVSGLFGDQMMIEGALRHPVFLYESLLNLVGLGIIFFFRYKKNKILELGDVGAFYLVWYGLVRTFTESLRLFGSPGDPLMMGPIPVSIFISAIFIVSGVTILILKRVLSGKLFVKRKLYHDELEDIRNQKPDTVIFDLDGTLLDTRELIYRSFIHTFAKFRPEKVLTDEELESFFGPTLRQTFEKYSDSEEEIKEMIEYYREFNIANHDNFVKEFRGVKSTLSTLKAKGYNIAVVSSKKDDLVKHGLDLCGILDYIDVVIGADSVENHKPAPDGILKAIEELKLNVEKKKEELANSKENDSKIKYLFKKMFKIRIKEVKDIYYIGDTLNDILAGKAANVKTIGVLYIPHPEVMLEANPSNVISKMSELLDICGE